MAAYLIADIEVFDAAAFEQYRQQVPAQIAAAGGKYLVRGGECKVMEGSWQPRRSVVLEFPTMAALEGWYHSPEYAPLLALRERAARTNLIFVHGV